MKTRLLTILLVALAAVTVSCKKGDSDTGLTPPTDKRLPEFSADANIPADLDVDLGICNHLKWRSGNLGATNAEDYGDYYAWGETETYYQDGDAQKDEKDVTWKEGKECGYDWSSYTKFISDNEITFDDNFTLLPEDDAASRILGGKWRIPTIEELEELIGNKNNEIEKEYVTLKGKPGWKFTSKVKGCEGNYIFLPAAGCRVDTTLLGLDGEAYYWSSSVSRDPDDSFLVSWGITLGSHSADASLLVIFIGDSVRPVCD